MTTFNQAGNKFYVGADPENPEAEITFQKSGDNKLTIDHTFVSDELREEGLGGQLVEKVVSFARDEGKKLDATCPYAKKKLEKTPEFQDVLAE